MRHATILVAILAFVPLAAAAAQVPVRPGARVRVTHLPNCPPDTMCVKTPRQSVGTFLAWKADSLVMESNGDTLAVPLETMTGLDMSRGRTTKAVEGAIIGGLLGAFAGGIIADLTYEAPRRRPQGLFGNGFIISDRGRATVAGVLVGGLGGAVAGALIGGLIKTDRWQEVFSVNQLRVNLRQQRNGRFGFGASVKF